jgi:hypothetical protein
MLVFFLSDYLVRGYDDQNLLYIRLDDVLFYQLIMLTILSIIVVTTMFVRSPRIESNVFRGVSRTPLDLGPTIRRTVFVLALAVLGAELYKRFSTVGWSLDQVMQQSLSPRGERDWDREIFAGNFLFAIASILLPFGAVASAFLFATGRGYVRYLSLSIFALLIVILVTDGSRTPVAIAFASLGVMWALKYKKLAMRAGALAIVMTILVLLFSLMDIYRSIGYIDTTGTSADREYRLVYQQDDNYYRAIVAYDYSDRTGKNWDPWFFFTTILVNPIPRAFWPEKPLFDETYYDGFKLSYVTNSFLGETVAMTGVTYSVIAAPVIGFLLYLILFNATRLLPMPMGTTVYMVFALYVYMCIRSLPNLTNFVYLPAFAGLTTVVLNQIYKRGARQHQPATTQPLVRR